MSKSLISTRVRRGLALITAHLEETTKWIDKPFKREVNFFFFFFFILPRVVFFYIPVLKESNSSRFYGQYFFFQQKFFHQVVSAREHLSWLGGWLRGCLCGLCLCWTAKEHSTTLTAYLPLKIQLGRDRLFIQIHHTRTLPSMCTQLGMKWSISMFRVQLSKSGQTTALWHPAYQRKM